VVVLRGRRPGKQPRPRCPVHPNSPMKSSRAPSRKSAQPMETRPLQTPAMRTSSESPTPCALPPLAWLSPARHRFRCSALEGAARVHDQVPDRCGVRTRRHAPTHSSQAS